MSARGGSASAARFAVGRAAQQDTFPTARAGSAAVAAAARRPVESSVHLFFNHPSTRKARSVFQRLGSPACSISKKTLPR
jgi:hypothetical protein